MDGRVEQTRHAKAVNVAKGNRVVKLINGERTLIQFAAEHVHPGFIFDLTLDRKIYQLYYPEIPFSVPWQGIKAEILENTFRFDEPIVTNNLIVWRFNGASPWYSEGGGYPFYPTNAFIVEEPGLEDYNVARFTDSSYATTDYLFTWQDATFVSWNVKLGEYPSQAILLTANSEDNYELTGIGNIFISVMGMELRPELLDYYTGYVYAALGYFYKNNKFYSYKFVGVPGKCAVYREDLEEEIPAEERKLIINGMFDSGGIAPAGMGTVYIDNVAIHRHARVEDIYNEFVYLSSIFGYDPIELTSYEDCEYGYGGGGGWH